MGARVSEENGRQVAQARTYLVEEASQRSMKRAVIRVHEEPEEHIVLLQCAGPDLRWRRRAHPSPFCRASETTEGAVS